jgi:hypothetical protein
MPTDEKFPTARLHEIADEIVELFRDEEQLPEDTIVELGDGVPMWGVGFTALHTFRLERLKQPIVFFLDRWAHPIRCNGKTVAYAESALVPGSTELYVPTITWGGLGSLLDGATDDVDEGTQFRVIYDTWLQVGAVWLRNSDIEASEIRMTGDNPRSVEHYGEADFIDHLRQIVPVGIVEDPAGAN